MKEISLHSYICNTIKNIKTKNITYERDIITVSYISKSLNIISYSESASKLT